MTSAPDRSAMVADAVALAVIGGPRLTMAEWETRSNAVAHGLRAMGVGPAKRVALVFDSARWVDLGVAWAATAKVGAVAVLLAPRLCPMELLRILAHCQPHLVVCPVDLRPDAEGAATTGAATVELSDLEHDRPTSPLEPPAANEAGEVLYRSGPLRAPEAIAPEAGTGPAPLAGVTRLLHAFSPGTEACLRALRLPLEHPGLTSAVVAGFDPEGLCAAVDQWKAQALGLTAALADVVIGSALTEGLDVSSVRQIMVAGGEHRTRLGELGRVFPGAEVSMAGPVATETGAAPAPADGATAPITRIQASMLWQEQFAPGRFNLQPLVRRLEGALDVEVLSKALDEIARRHHSLRTTFEVIDGEPVQRLRPAEKISLAVVDLGTLPSDRREAEVARVVAGETSRPPDLVNGRLFQPRLLRLGTDDHLLVIALHHCVWDAWSVGVFHRELSALYEAFIAGEVSPLAEPALQIADVGRQEHALLAGPAGDAQRRFWEERLAGCRFVSQLPIHDPALAPGTPHPPANPVARELPEPLCDQVRALARSQRTTLFMTLLAAFQVLACTRAGTDDLLVSSVAARRERADVGDVLGCVVNRVPLRLRLSGDPTFVDVLAGARAAVVDAISHPDLCDDVLLEEVVGPAASAHGLTPRIMVLFQAAPLPRPLRIAGLATSPVTAGGMAAKRVHMTSAGGRAGAGNVPWGAGLFAGTFLGLSVMERPSGVTLVARGAFHLPTVEGLLGEYEALLGAVVAQPGQRLSELGVFDVRPPAPEPGGVIDLRGVAVEPGRIETALAAMGGVGDVKVVMETAGTSGPRLAAYVAPEDGFPAPTVGELRAQLWRELPGYAWPAKLNVVDGPAGVEARFLASLWADARGAAVGLEDGYRQSFSFAEAVAEAYQAGLAVTRQQVIDNSTVTTLATAVAVSRRRPGSVGGDQVFENGDHRGG